MYIAATCLSGAQRPPEGVTDIMFCDSLLLLFHYPLLCTCLSFLLGAYIKLQHHTHWPFIIVLFRHYHLSPTLASDIFLISLFAILHLVILQSNPTHKKCFLLVTYCLEIMIIHNWNEEFIVFTAALVSASAVHFLLSCCSKELDESKLIMPE